MQFPWGPFVAEAADFRVLEFDVREPHPSAEVALRLGGERRFRATEFNDVCACPGSHASSQDLR